MDSFVICSSPRILAQESAFPPGKYAVPASRVPRSQFNNAKRGTHVMILVPEDPTLSSTNFYILRNGLKSPVEFVVRDDGGVDLFIGRYRYPKVD